MDWNKALGYLSNMVAVVGLIVLAIAILMLVPGAQWVGPVIGAIAGGIVGYLKGISTGPSSVNPVENEVPK